MARVTNPGLYYPKDSKQPTSENLDCADLILQRNGLPVAVWGHLRRDIALAMTLAEEDARKKEARRQQAIRRKGKR